MSAEREFAPFHLTPGRCLPDHNLLRQGYIQVQLARSLAERKFQTGNRNGFPFFRPLQRKS